jgi:hypothetical protein
MATFTTPKFIGTRRTESEKSVSKSSELWIEFMKKLPTIRFAICLKNKGCEDLTVRKVYQVLPDEKANQRGLVRVIDESGEDYLYPASFFFLIDLPQKVERVLRQRVSATA